MKKSLVTLCLPLLLVISCSSDSGSSSNDAARPTSNSPARKSLASRLDENNGYKQDQEGNWLPQNDKRSSFETNRESKYFNSEFTKKDFKTKDYSKKSWWGDTKYETKKFEGDTDGSRFQTASKFQNQGAREANTNAKLPGAYQTSDYATSSAREGTSKRMEHTSDAETDFRRKVYGAPSVIDWREQRAMSVGQTKGILGR